jgi:hypothetical protein
MTLRTNPYERSLASAISRIVLPVWYCLDQARASVARASPTTRACLVDFVLRTLMGCRMRAAGCALQIFSHSSQFIVRQNNPAARSQTDGKDKLAPVTASGISPVSLASLPR